MTSLIRRACALAATVLVLSGCAGGDGSSGNAGDGRSGLGGRPSAEDIADSIRAGTSGLGVPPSQADCAAKLAVDSDMSDQAIGRYVDQDDPSYVDGDDYAFTESDRAAFDKLLGDLKSECGYVQPGG